VGVGATFQYLLAKFPEGGPMGEAEDDSPLVPLGAGPHGWAFFGFRQRLPLALLDEAVMRMAGEMNQPALGLYVETSDWGYVVVADGQGSTGAAVIGGHDAADFAEGQWALRRCIDQAGKEAWRAEAAARLAAWSRLAPASVQKEAVLRLLRRRPLFPEDVVVELLRNMGLELPPPEPIRSLDERGFSEARFVIDSGTSPAGAISVDQSKTRFVRGYGEGFLGIWDRQAPGAPIRRFDESDRWEWAKSWLLMELADLEQNLAEWTMEQAIQHLGGQ
jgi:hypothetical protein